MSQAQILHNHDQYTLNTYKRRKLSISKPDAYNTQNSSTLLRPTQDPVQTPVSIEPKDTISQPKVTSTNPPESDAMEIDPDTPFECPCGYLHGPGSDEHHDILAVGLASQPLLRGPD